MFLKPVAGRQVPDPDRGGLLPPEGRDIDLHQYWQRRINDGDVIEVVTVTEPVSTPVTPATTTPKAKE